MHVPNRGPIHQSVIELIKEQIINVIEPSVIVVDVICYKEWIAYANNSYYVVQ